MGLQNIALPSEAVTYGGIAAQGLSSIRRHFAFICTPIYRLQQSCLAIYIQLHLHCYFRSQRSNHHVDLLSNPRPSQAATPACPKQRGAAVIAGMAGNGLSVVRDLTDSLGRASGNGKAA